MGRGFWWHEREAFLSPIAEDWCWWSRRARSDDAGRNLTQGRKRTDLTGGDKELAA